METALLSFFAGIVLVVIVWGYSEKPKSIWIFSIIPIFVVLIWYYWGTFGAQLMLEDIQNNAPTSHIKKENSVENSTQKSPEVNDEYLSKLGQTGDIFGGINALFAALALSGVAAATIMQAKSLQLAKEQQLQQTFEPLFFHLLNLHKEVAAPKFKLRGDFISSSRPITKRENSEESGLDFSRAIQILRRGLRMKVGGLSNLGAKNDKLLYSCKIHYDSFYEINQNELGPHFRTLFQIFKLIHHSSFNADTKIRYANIARSTLSKDQLFLLSVNCLSDYGAAFKPLVEEYGLLKHVDRSKLKPTIDQTIADFLFEKSATQGSKERRNNNID